MKDRRDFLIHSTALLSGMFTFFFLKDLIGLNETWKWFPVIGLATIVVVAMDHFIDRYALTRDKIYLLYLLPCMISSMLGTVGSFQVEIQKQIENSKDYLRRQSARDLAAGQVEKWQSAADNPEISAWALKKSEEAMKNVQEADRQLAEMSTGSVINAFSDLGKRYGMNAQSLLFYFLLFVAAGVDMLHAHVRVDKLRNLSSVTASKAQAHRKRKRKWWFTKRRNVAPDLSSDMSSDGTCAPQVSPQPVAQLVKRTASKSATVDKILAQWDSGVRNRQRIADAVGCSRQHVSRTLIDNGRG